jgi:hypothetical protein
MKRFHRLVLLLMLVGLGGIMLSAYADDPGTSVSNLGDRLKTHPIGGGDPPTPNTAFPYRETIDEMMRRNRQLQEPPPVAPTDDGTETNVSDLQDQLSHSPISGKAPDSTVTLPFTPNLDEIGKLFENPYQNGNVPYDGSQGVPPADMPANPEAWSETEVAVATGVGTTLGAGVAGLGAWLMLGQIGVGRREAFEDMGGLLRGQLPDDGFDAWKAKHQALGWKYVEENGIARFIPPDQAPVSPPIERPSQDGDVNPATGEIWSAEDGGWVGRNLYEQNQRRAQDIAAIEARSADAMQEYDAQTRDRKSTRLNSSHRLTSRMPSSA